MGQAAAGKGHAASRFSVLESWTFWLHLGKKKAAPQADTA